MAEYTVEEFENKCMDIIEKIVSLSPTQTRAQAIVVAEKMLEKAKEKTSKKSVIDIYERVVHEFKIATDEEYNMLRKQIFS
ncbi:MAG TPA: hypothetical protein IAB72_01590 [Candidatus Onthoplasma faecipullorum]|nr:hypothetical protein [Candidatus Onthoplasma faecipullorum]